jgi:triphosphoribosyl-dephospho-CoA synthase
VTHDGVTRSPAAVAEASWQACLLEASAEKPGNVTPSSSFHDMSYADLLHSAQVARPVFARAGARPVGATVLAAVRARRRVVAANTNLGIALLFAPVARAALDARLDEGPLRARVAAVLRGLDEADARDAYEAIRRASAGGLGERAVHDVRSVPTIGLREAMAAAADRDSVASEYVTDYAIVFDDAVPALERAFGDGLSVDYAIVFEHALPALEQAFRDGLPVLDAVVELHLGLLAERPDTLIARRCGADRARAVSAAAAAVVAAGGVRTARGRREIERFDASLRGPRNRLNPGTTADLIAATLFVALLEGVGPPGGGAALRERRAATLLP